MSKIVSGVFKTRTDAEGAIAQLENAGFSENQISLLMSDETLGKGFQIVKEQQTGEGAAVGAALGGVMGALLTSIGAAAVIGLPGLNLIAAGPLASVLAGFGAGGLTGGLVGGLVGSGIEEHEAKLYDAEVRNGRLLVTVECEDATRAKQVEDILERAHAFSVAA